MWRAIETARNAPECKLRARGGEIYRGSIYGDTNIIAYGKSDGVPLTHWQAEVPGGSKWRDPGDGRKSRLHDQRNARVPTSRVLRNAPRAALSFAWFKLTGARPRRPWIPYDAARRLDELLTSEMKVLEYGSGMSTRWFAQRVASVRAIDDDAEWLAMQGTTPNVTLVHATDEQAYCRQEGTFDFIMIDGLFRASCARAALDLLKPGGYVYLDNADSFEGYCAAEVLHDAMVERAGTVEPFTDFVPTLAHPTTGHLYRF